MRMPDIVCHVCFKPFSKRRAYRQHLMRHHHMELPKGRWTPVRMSDDDYNREMVSLNFHQRNGRTRKREREAREVAEAEAKRLASLLQAPPPPSPQVAPRRCQEVYRPAEPSASGRESKDTRGFRKGTARGGKAPEAKRPREEPDAPTQLTRAQEVAALGYKDWLEDSMSGPDFELDDFSAPAGISDDLVPEEEDIRSDPNATPSPRSTRSPSPDYSEPPPPPRVGLRMYPRP